ncbi:hypothetical protein CWI84_01105 [Idiomarina tyrosinivorans]|uniref:Photosynthesis system II assembly factor Ycf48/Hcf136-like domain-containing protein n=1 Tax=Idiomarina tyrosinivorans TaxID=1445662 RepID=A0A432ZTW6_9GAMM|nr:YCF48-related protein [Idiomarina tyrosinivorans]RUO81385.1 hypothetical protein CWI84_01105 [Idiomarina tyrosinivorans]
MRLRSAHWGLVVVLFSGAVTAAQSNNEQQAEQGFDVIYADSLPSNIADQAVLIDFADAGSRTVTVGAHGDVLFRSNEQDQWQKAQVATSVLLTSVDFANPKQGWAVGHHGVIIHTSDGGQSWQRQFTGFDLISLEAQFYQNKVKQLQQQLAANPDDSDLSYALDDAQFQLQNVEIAQQEGPSKPLLSVYAVDANTLLASGAYGTLLKSDDGGKQWRLASDAIDNPNGFHLNALCGSGNKLFIAGEAGLVFRSNDAGATWQTLTSPYNGSFFGCHVDAQDNLWIYGLRGHAFRSSDWGDSFSAVTTNTSVNLSGGYSTADGTTYLVGHSGTIVKWRADDVKVYTHPSGAVLTNIHPNPNGGWWLVGRQGVLSWSESQQAAQK